MINKTLFLKLQKCHELDYKIIEKISRRQGQMLVHSYIYYTLGTSIIPDNSFDSWAYELVQLQQQFPEETKLSRYHTQFINWDGKTGYNLDTLKVRHIAERLMRLKK